MKRIVIELFSWWSGVTMGTRLYTRFCGERVGEDAFGAVYYRRGERRWVVYRDLAEPSLVPPEWHGWLHHRTNRPPDADDPERRPWQAPHRPNLTGTDYASFPAGADVRTRNADGEGDAGESRSRSYEPWRPE